MANRGIEYKPSGFTFSVGGSTGGTGATEAIIISSGASVNIPVSLVIPKYSSHPTGVQGQLYLTLRTTTFTDMEAVNGMSLPEVLAHQGLVAYLAD